MLTHRSNTIIFIFGILLFFAVNQHRPVSYWFPVILLIFWVSVSALGSFFIQWNYHLHALHRNKATAGRKIALTFDDGPTEYTAEVLDLLKAFDQKATFFCIGKQAEKFPELIKRILEEGHVVGNHTYSHSNTTGFLNTKEMLAEIQEANRSVHRISGKKMKLYRPPFGVTNPSIKNAVKASGHRVIGWSIRSLDTIIKDSDRIIKRVLKRLSPGKVVLLHDTSGRTVNVLRELLIEMKKNNYQSLTINELFNIEAYEV